MNLRYLPGDWRAAVTPHGFALLPTDLGLVLVEGIWGRIARGGGLGGMLEALTGAFGTSLSAIPSFAVVLISGTDARLAVRGPLAVTVQTTDGGSEIVSGLGVTTWSERAISDVASIEVAGTDAAGDDTNTAWYPIVDGIVPASAVQVVLAAVTTGPIVTPPAVQSDEVAASVASTPPLVRAVTIPVATEPDAPAAPAETEPVDDTWLPVSDTTRLEHAPDAGPVAAGLIDGVPGASHEDDDEEDYEAIWGETIMQPPSVEAAAPPAHDAPTPASSAPASAVSDPGADADNGDHDGETITFAQAQSLRADVGPTLTPPPPVTDAVVDAHGWIEVSTGERVELDRPIVIGRRPRAVRVTSGVLPHLIAVPSPQQDISRSHVELRREGDATLVVDLDTTNGTVLHRAGAAPTRLHPGDTTILIDGDVIDLGDEVTVTVRGIR